MSPCDTRPDLLSSPGLPQSPEGDPVFAEPWHAQAFAMTLHLYDRGVFGWGEWAEMLSQEVHKLGRADDGSDYFDAWVEALSALLAAKGVADAATILSLQQSWQRAAEATPHGVSIALANDPERKPG